MEMRPPKKDAAGNPIFNFAGCTLELRDGFVVMRISYMANEQSKGQLPALALTAEQCAFLSGKLQPCVLELKGSAPVTPLRRN